MLINTITRTLKWSRFRQLPAQIKKTSKVNLPKGYEPSSIKSMMFVSKTFPVWLLEQSAVPSECFHSHLRVFWRSPGRKHCHRCSHEDQSFPQCLGSLALGPWLKIIVLLAKLIIQDARYRHTQGKSWWELKCSLYLGQCCCLWPWSLQFSFTHCE